MKGGDDDINIIKHRHGKIPICLNVFAWLTKAAGDDGVDFNMTENGQS